VSSTRSTVDDDPSDVVIAVVDDDPRILQSLQNLLESIGYTVRVFDSATALLERTGLEEIDCVISDVNMPVIDGLELSRRLHRTMPALPIILITGHPEMLTRSLVETSHYRLFTKPYDPDALVIAIGDMLRNR
jgi:FixJ family two-component response regulator